jgi:hypothetical protein
MDARNPGGSSIKMSSSLNRSTFSKNCSQDARRPLSLLESSVDSYPESNPILLLGWNRNACKMF